MLAQNAENEEKAEERLAKLAEEHAKKAEQREAKEARAEQRRRVMEEKRKKDVEALRKILLSHNCVTIKVCQTKQSWHGISNVRNKCYFLGFSRVIQKSLILYSYSRF